MKIIYINLLILFFIPFSLNAKEKMVLAVIDFKAKGVPYTLAEQISELIRTEMINTGQYKVLERNQMSKILKEQEFQQTGCTDISCAVKAGQLLSAHKILIGSVMRLGKYIIINGRIVDVRDGNAKFAEQEKAISDENIPNAVKIFTLRLTKRIKGDIETGEIHAYHSPYIAGCVSVLPFWSGSFNKGFNWWGATFTGAKILSLSMFLSYTSDPDEIEEKKRNGEYNKTREYISLTGFGLLSVFTIIDIIYSAISTSNYNAEHGFAVKNNMENISFAIVTRKSYYNYKDRLSYISDGLNLKVSYKF